MFRKLIEKLKQAREPFDPTVFDDPVAAETKWTPVKGGGANFRTHKLVQAGENRMEFRATVGSILFSMVFLLAGLGISTGFLVSQLSAGTFAFEAKMILPVLFGLLFAAAGGLLLYFATIPIIYDKRSGFFWKGWKMPDRSYVKNSSKKVARLDDIYALQIISEYCSSSKSSYYSYELNIVLKNTDRINVVDHGNLKRLTKDAGALGEFLGVPVWNAAGE